MANSANEARVSVAHQFPNPTWLENLAVRSNGNVLVTSLLVPEVWEVNPFDGSAKLVHKFDGATSVSGITETEHDVFAIGIGNASFTSGFSPEKGSWQVWSVDLQQRDAQAKKDGDDGKASASKVATVAPAGLINGMTTLHSNPSRVLLADSVLGIVWAIDLKTGSYYNAIEIPEFKVPSYIPDPLGLNGIHTTETHLYYSNTENVPCLCRIPIDAEGKATGPNEVIVKTMPYPKFMDLIQLDDFALDLEHNRVYVCGNADNNIAYADLKTGEVTVVAGGLTESIVAGATAAAFGRTEKDRHILYITTTGGIVNPPAGGVEGGKLLALDTKGL